MIAIVDYGAGNLQSVKKALDYIGAACEITADAKKIQTAQGVILPGVGSFGDAMDSMRRRGLFEPVRQAANGDRPFLGICLGLQLLFACSQESPGAAGLDVLPGQVLRFSAAGQKPRQETLNLTAGQRKVPHMGWNSLALQRQDGLFAGVPQNAYAYFVHSYYVQAQSAEHVAALTEYGLPFHAAVCCGQLWATQFHPEKSGETGLCMLRNFVGML
jgi:glutamine amidotransferase